MSVEPKTKDLSQDELLRYSRHFNLDEVGLEGQKHLKAARVLCIGAGGLGSPTLLYLAAAGIGTLGLIDSDHVDLSNLQRQILYSHDNINDKKVACAELRLKSLNPEINIEAYETRLTESNALELIGEYDIVVDGSDNFATRYLVNDACFHLKKPNVFASIFQFEGQLSVFTANNGPCYRCLYPSPPPPGLVPNCAEGGVLGVLPGVMGTLQATEVIKLILGIGEPLCGRLLCFNALAMSFKELEIKTAPGCILCEKQQAFESLPHHTQGACTMFDHVKEITVQELQQLREQQADFVLLDVREPFEVDICDIGGVLIPLGELPNRLNELDKNKRVIAHCKLGGRSAKAVKLLEKEGFNAENLKGGIIAWIDEIDPSLKRY